MIKNQLNTMKQAKLCDVFMLIYLITINIELFSSSMDAILQNIAYLAFIFFAMIEMKFRLRITTYLMMYGSFFVFACMSVMWSVSISGTLSLLRILIKVFVIAVIAGSYYRTQGDFERVLSLVFYSLLFVVIYVALASPQSDWLFENLGESFGIDTVRYSVRAMLCASIGVYFWHSRKRILYLIPILICGTLAMLTGKRTSIIFLLVFIAIYYILLQETVLKRFKMIFIIVGVVALLLVLIYNVDMLYDSIGIRIDSLISTLSGNSEEDLSAINRSMLMERSWESFVKSPIWGNGLNSQRAILESENFIQVTYAHNNMLEIASGLGVIGVLLYYNMYISSVCTGMRVLKRDKIPQLAMIISLFFAYFVCDFVQVIYESYFENIMLAFLVAGVQAYSYKSIDRS